MHVMQCMEVFGGNRSASESIVTKGLDAWLYSRPFASVGARVEGGGDIHFLTSCATGRVTRLLLADVSGHGPGVAQAASELRRLLGAFSNYIDQLRFVAAVNRRFGSLEGNAGRGLFATAVVATFFAPDAELTVTSAGHPPPLLYRAGAGSWEAIDVRAPDDAPGLANLPLGVDGSASYFQTVTRMGRGDVALFFTDALLEARSAQGRMLGVEGVRRLLSGVDASHPDRLVSGLLDAVDTYRGVEPGTQPLEDDVTILVVRPNGLGPTPSLGLGLAGGWRVIREGARGLLREGRVPAMPEWSVRNLVGAFRRPGSAAGSAPGRGPGGA